MGEGPAGPAAVIPNENLRPGSDQWYERNSRFAPANQLALWASPYAATVGDTLAVFIHATWGPVDLSLFRLGWYGGHGGRLMWAGRDLPADPQPDCSRPLGGPVTCPWNRTLQLPLDAGWPSGMYLLKATDQAGKVAFYPFVVRDHRSAPIVVVISQFTWQAYNPFGGTSLYYDTTVARGMGHAVSFERPYAWGGGMGSALASSGTHDLWVVQWLERNGYDVTYVSDLDLARLASPDDFQGRVLLFAGHDEYWTWAEYDHVQQLRDLGIHLAFFSGNDAYWNVRLEPGPVMGRPDNVIVCYKNNPDPGATTLEKTTRRFRDLGRPENQLLGVMFQHVSHDTWNRRPLVVSDSGLGPEALDFLHAAGLQPGDTIPGVITGEGDQLVNNGQQPADLQVVFRSGITPEDGSHYPPYYYGTFFVAPSGAGVFASGSNEYATKLSHLSGPPDAQLDRFTRNVLDWMLAH